MAKAAELVVGAARALVIAIVCLPWVANARTVAVYQKVDEFRGTTVYFTEQEKPALEGGTFWSGRYVYFNFMALSPMDSPATGYDLKVEANLESWMFIKSGASLVLKVDGEFLPLTSPGSLQNRTVLGANSVVETAYYSFPKETLDKIAGAKEITFRLYGDNDTITGSFTPRMMEDVKFFAENAPGLIAGGSPSAPAVTTKLPSIPMPAGALKFGAFFAPITPTLATTFHSQAQSGVVLLTIAPDSAAARAGLVVGDVVATFDGKATASAESMRDAVTAHGSGPAALSVYSADKPLRSVLVNF